MGRLSLGLVLLLAVVPCRAQQPASKQPNELVKGKLIYVAPMPANLDKWVMDFLKRWGKYKVTGNPEGVDLVMKAYNPEKENEYKMRGGIPVPRDSDKGKYPIHRKKREDLPVISITVIDWVTDQPLWHADIIDRNRKKNEPEPPAGAQTEIYARDMTPDQLAQRITMKLREYVAELEKGEAPKPEGNNQQ
jgi:hypothetical protein